MNLLVSPAALTDIILTNLLAEITAASLTGVADGGAIASLTPARGSKVDALTQGTTGNQPTKIAAASHGHPAIKRVASQALVAPTWAAATAAGTALTFYLVHRMAVIGTTGTQYVFRGGGAGSTIAYAHSFSTAGYTASTTATGAPAPQQHQLDTGWQITAITMDAGVVTVRQNNIIAPGTVNLSTGTMSLGGIGIGGIGGGTAGYEEHISAVYAYTGKHTNDEISQMMLYLSSLWSVPLDAVA
jgi:hypothetical protein